MRSNADAYPRAVLSPNRSVPIPGVVTKELILFGYNLSLCALDGLYASLTALLITPLACPAGENQG